MTSPVLDARITTVVGDRRDSFAVTANLRLESGVLVLFGPSGTGKSLTLRSLAGLIRPKAGSIRFGNTVYFDAERRIHIPPHRRRFGYVPQHNTLFPFCDVAANVAFGLPWRERRDTARVDALLEELGIAHLRNARPTSLSGGERQRVALARALILRPPLLLLDEPFASIDEEGRHMLRRVLREALRRHGTPAVLVTHDPSDALDVGDQLLRFERGRSTVQGTPPALLAVPSAALR